MIRKYESKRLRIQAVQYDGSQESVDAIKQLIGDVFVVPQAPDNKYESLVLRQPHSRTIAQTIRPMHYVFWVNYEFLMTLDEVAFPVLFRERS